MKRRQSGETTGTRIRNLRKEKNYTQTQLSKLLHVEMQAVSNWERDQNNVDSSILPKLAEALDTSIDYLMCYTNEARAIEKIVHQSSEYQKKKYDVDFDNALLLEDIEKRFDKAPERYRYAVKKALHDEGFQQAYLKKIIWSFLYNKELELQSLDEMLFTLQFVPPERFDQYIDNYQGFPVDVFIMYAFAPYVSQDTMDYWALNCDCCTDADMSAQIMQYLSSEVQREFLLRCQDEARPDSFAKGFKQFLTEDMIDYLFQANDDVMTNAETLSDVLDEEHIETLVNRCLPDSIPALASHLSDSVKKKTIQLLINRCDPMLIPQLADNLPKVLSESEVITLFHRCEKSQKNFLAHVIQEKEDIVCSEKAEENK